MPDSGHFAQPDRADDKSGHGQKHNRDGDRDAKKAGRRNRSANPGRATGGEPKPAARWFNVIRLRRKSPEDEGVGRSRSGRCWITLPCKSNSK